MENHTKNISVGIPVEFQEEQPPAYSSTFTNPNSNVLSPVDRFSHILANNQFNFYSTGRIGFTTRTVVVQIRDSSDRPLVSCLTTPGTTVSHGDNQSLRIGAIFTLTDISGQTLLIGKENGQSVTITSGDQILGILDGLGLCSSSKIMRNVMGDSVFQICDGSGDAVSSSPTGCFLCSSSSDEFTFMSNGIPIARMGKSSANPNQIEFTVLSQNLDNTTKALAIFSAYITYSNFFADTSFGRIGYRGLAKKIMLCFCLISITFMLLFILIPVFVISQ